MDYGSMGAIIGHEISHSFDDQGAQFDSTGKLNNWWKPEDFAHFKKHPRSSRNNTTSIGRSRISRSMVSRC
jgi:predicted metalloendopeptidase